MILGTALIGLFILVCFYVARLSIRNVDAPLHELLLNSFALKLRLSFMPSWNGRLVFRIERLHVFVRVMPVLQQQRRKNYLLDRLRCALGKAGIFVGRVLGMFIAVRIDDMKVILAPHGKDAEYTKNSTIDYLTITGKDMTLSACEIKAHLAVMHCSTKDRLCVKILETCITIKGLREIEIEDDNLDVSMTPEALATVGAFAYVVGAVTEEFEKDSSEALSFHGLNGLGLRPIYLKIKLALTTSPADFTYFESVCLTLEGLEAFVKEGVIFANCREGAFITEASDEPGTQVSCKAYRLLDLDKRTKEHKMITAHGLSAQISLNNRRFEDFGYGSFNKAQEFIRSLGTKDFNYKHFLPTRQKSEEVSMEGRYLVFDVKGEEVEFYCAFEYPLTLVFDELANVIKGSFGIKPSSLNGNLMIAHCYALSVLVKDVKFGLADGTFERRLEECFTKKEKREKYSCMEITGRDVHFVVKWDNRLLEGGKFHILVNRMENDTFITEQHCEQLTTCIGGFTELHATELAVVVKDHAEYPLVKAPKLSIMGLLFLLEIEPYEEALLEAELQLKHYAENQESTKEGRFGFTTVITPIKLFHALIGHIYSTDQLVPQINYSLYWSDTFESVSRGFEVFATPLLDPSPVMSVFDKMPYLNRGCHTTLAVKGRCRVRIGLDAPGEEVIEVQLVDGLTIGIHGRWVLEMSAAKVVADSLALRPFHKVLAAEGLAMNIAALPACTASIDFVTNSKCSHWQVKPKVKPADDTYREYRTKTIHLRIEFAFDPAGKVQVNYHREVEDWLTRAIRRFSGGVIKAGKLWSSYLIVLIPPDEWFAACLKELSMHIQIPCALEITFVTITEEHVLVRLNASHGDFVFGFGRKSYQGGFRMVYSDSDYNDIVVRVSTPEDAVESRTFLRSDRLAYVAAAEDYFAEAGTNIILEHLERLKKRQDEEPVRQVHKLLQRVKDGKDLMTRKRFTVYRAYITWDEDLRNAIFKIVDAQIVYEMSNQAQQMPLGATERIIREMQRDQRRSSLGPNRMDSPQEQAQTMMRELINEAGQGPFIARKESSTERKEEYATDSRSVRELALALGLGAFSTTIVEVKDVQIGLCTVSRLGLRKGQPEAVILTLPRIKFTSSLLWQEGKPLFRRSVVQLNEAKVSVAYNKFFSDVEEWPPFVQKSNEAYFLGVTNQVNLRAVYDSAWNSMDQISIVDKDGEKYELRGSKILVECPAFELQCSNEEYYVIYELILNLLVYRDQNMSRRSQKTSQLIQSYHIQDGEKLLQKIQELKEELATAGELFMSEEWEEKRAVLYALSEIVHSWRNLRERQEQKQSRLELVVVLRKLSWQLALKGAYVAEATLTDLIDNWISEEDGSMSNSLEIHSINVNNIMSGAFYRTMLSPLTDAMLHRLQIEQDGEPLSTANYGNQVRLFVRTSFPDVGKVCVEHAEIDVAPMFVRITQEIVEVLFEFFFPPEGDKSMDEDEGDEEKGEEHSKQYFSFVVVPPSRHLVSFKVFIHSVFYIVVVQGRVVEFD